MSPKEITNKLFSINFDTDLNDDNVSKAYLNKKLYYDEYIGANDLLVKETINKWKEKGYGLR